MKILALDTSNRPMSVALVEDGQLKATTTLNTVINHSIFVLPTIDELCKKINWQPEDLDRIVVAQGPGSYTGIRIAVTMAKTLAMTLGKDLVGVSGLKLLASNVPPMTDKLIVPFMDARRGNVFAGIYAYQNGQLRQLTTLSADAHLSFSDLLDQLQKDGRPAVLLGQATARLKKHMPESLPDQLTLLPESYAIPDTGRLALLGQAEQPVNDIDSFVPHYLRITEAEANWKKAHPDAKAENYVREV